MAKLVAVQVYGILLLLVVASSCNSGFAQNPGLILAKALTCFNDNKIYNRCNAAYRLTQSGYINVPYAATNQFCYGPCLSETHRVLDCVDHSLSTFVFYNKATINTLRSTLRSACGHDHERGNFNVEEYMNDYYEDEFDAANLPLAPSYLFTITLSTAVFLLTARAIL